MGKPDFNKSQYETHYRQYLDSNLNNEIGGGSIEERIALVKKSLPLGRLILEIGSGGGDDALALENAGYRVIPSEFVKGFIDIMETKGLNPLMLDAKKDSLPLTDAIYANAVFVHFSPVEIEKFLKKAADSLKGEKLLIFSLIKGEGHETSKRNRGFEREFYYYTLDSITPLLNKSGFIVSKSEDKGPKWLQIVANAN